MLTGTGRPGRFSRQCRTVRATSIGRLMPAVGEIRGLRLEDRGRCSPPGVAAAKGLFAADHLVDHAAEGEEYPNVPSAAWP